MSRGWTLEQSLLMEPPPPRFRNFEGHSRDHKWKDARPTGSGMEPVPDAGGYKVYLITNKHNDKVYVGITIGPLANRLKQHFAAAHRGRKSAFTNAIRKYGEDAFSIFLIRDDAKTFAELQLQEIAEIEARDSIRNGYNTAVGGSLGTAKSITVDGKYFPSRNQAAEFFGIDPTVFNIRLERLKWTPEEAAGLLEKTWAGKANPVTVDGVRYPSLRAAAIALGVRPATAFQRFRKKGWSIEQSLGLAPPPKNDGPA